MPDVVLCQCGSVLESSDDACTHCRFGTLTPNLELARKVAAEKGNICYVQQIGLNPSQTSRWTFAWTKPLDKRPYYSIYANGKVEAVNKPDWLIPTAYDRLGRDDFEE